MPKVIGRRVVLTGKTPDANLAHLARVSHRLQELVNRNQQKVLMERFVRSLDADLSFGAYPIESVAMGLRAPSLVGGNYLQQVLRDLTGQQEAVRDDEATNPAIDCDLQAISYREHGTGWLYIGFSSYISEMPALLASLPGFHDFAQWEQQFSSSNKNAEDWKNRRDKWTHLMVHCPAEFHNWKPRAVDTSSAALLPFVPSLQERAVYQAERLTLGWAFAQREAAIGSGSVQDFDLSIELMAALDAELRDIESPLHQEFQTRVERLKEYLPSNVLAFTESVY